MRIIVIVTITLAAIKPNIIAEFLFSCSIGSFWDFNAFTSEVLGIWGEGSGCVYLVVFSCTFWVCLGGTGLTLTYIIQSLNLRICCYGYFIITVLYSADS